MRLENIKDPDVINLLTYQYEREDVVRTVWLQNNRDLLEKAATHTKEPKGNYPIDVLVAEVLVGVDYLKNTWKGEKILRQNRRPREGIDAALAIGVKGPTKVGPAKPRVELSDTDFLKEPNMRPVDSKYTDILYSHKPKARLQYLAKRCHLPPEVRYCAPASTNWEYGWKVKESPLYEFQYHEKNKNEHGRQDLWELAISYKCPNYRN